MLRECVPSARGDAWDMNQRRRAKATHNCRRVWKKREQSFELGGGKGRKPRIDRHIISMGSGGGKFTCPHQKKKKTQKTHTRKELRQCFTDPGRKKDRHYTRQGRVRSGIAWSWTSPLARVDQHFTEGGVFTGFKKKRKRRRGIRKSLP